MSKRLFTRREMLGLTGLGIASAAMMFGCENRRRIPMGVQLYQLRHECGEDLERTLAALAEMGYDGVEFYGYFGHSPTEVRKILDRSGLECSGSHVRYQDLQTDTLIDTIQFNRIIGNRYLIVPSLPKELTGSREGWEQALEFLNELSTILKPFEMFAGYHGHDYDFREVDGIIPWEFVAENTPDEFVMQMDTGNCLRGGGDPVAYLKRYPGRTKTIHLKEYSTTHKVIPFEGDVPWEEVFEQCRSGAGTEWFIIEEEKELYPPLQAMEMCMENYRGLGY